MGGGCEPSATGPVGYSVSVGSTGTPSADPVGVAVARLAGVADALTVAVGVGVSTVPGRRLAYLPRPKNQSSIGLALARLRIRSPVSVVSRTIPASIWAM